MAYKITRLSLICLPRKPSEFDYFRTVKISQCACEFFYQIINLHKAVTVLLIFLKIINLRKAVIVLHVFLKSTDISLHLPKFKSHCGVYFTLFVNVWYKYNFTKYFRNTRLYFDFICS